MNKKCRRDKLCTIKLFKGFINIRKYEITICIIQRFDHRIFIFDKSNFVLKYKLNIVLSSIDDYQVESFYKQESKMKGVLRELCQKIQSEQGTKSTLALALIVTFKIGPRQECALEQNVKWRVRKSLLILCTFTFSFRCAESSVLAYSIQFNLNGWRMVQSRWW